MRKSVSLSIFILCVSLLAPRPSPINSQTPLDFELVQMLGRGTANSIAWSPDGETLAVGGSRGIWLVEDNFQTISLLEGHPPNVTLIEWSPDGSKIATLANKDVYLWDMHTATLKRLIGQYASITDIAWRPDGSQIATPSIDGTIHIWDANTGVLLKTLIGNSDYKDITDAAWNPAINLNQLATSSADGSLQLWDIDTGQLLSELRPPNAAFTSLAWNPTGALLAVASTWNIYIYNPSSQQIENTLEAPEGRILRLLWSPEGHQLISVGSPKTYTWAMHDFSLDAVWEEQVTILAWHPNASLVAGLTADSLVVWDANTRERVAQVEGFFSEINEIAWDGEGAYLLGHYFDDQLRIWDSASKEVVASIALGASHLAWNMARSQMAATVRGDDIRIWDWFQLWQATLDTPSTAPDPDSYLINTMMGHTNYISAIAWSPDGSKIASSDEDYTVRLWNPHSSSDLFTLQHASQVVAALAWHPYSDQLASVDDSGTIYIWNPHTGQKISEMRDPSDTSFAISLAWHPDGSLLASGSVDGYVRIWDRQDNRLISRIQAHEGQIFALAWHPDGSLLASAGGDGFIQLWEAATGELIDSLAGHVDEIRALAWRPDGTQLASAGLDGTIHIWEHIQD